MTNDEQRRDRALAGMATMRTRLQKLELAFEELRAMQRDLEQAAFELAELGDGVMQ